MSERLWEWRGRHPNWPEGEWSYPTPKTRALIRDSACNAALREYPGVVLQIRNPGENWKPYKGDASA